MFQNACYRWSFTFNKNDNIDQTDDEFRNMHIYLTELFNDLSWKYIFQLERGEENHRLHYQGHIKLPTKLRLNGLIKSTKDRMPGTHFSPDSTRGSTQAEFYCIKRDQTYVEGPWHDNSYEMPYDGRDLIEHHTFYPWQLELSTIIHGPIHPDKIMWIYQPEGGCGKSSYCKFMYFHFKYPQLIVCKPTDLMHLVFTSKSSEAYFIDIQRTLGQDQTMDSLYSSIEQLKNGYIVNTKYVTGIKLFAKPHVVVFSNIRPDTKKLSNYKWDLYKIENFNLIKENI
nr:rep protein [Cressdnaviricota sp.]UOF81293.1 rep protein [Cressdnaviricota sp.]